MQENQYFTPSIEDIRVGYECEVKPINESLGWQKGILHYNSGYKDESNPNSIYNLYPFWWTWRNVDNSWQTIAQIHSLKNIRTPYLTKEQIEADGWEYMNSSKFSRTR